MSLQTIIIIALTLWWVRHEASHMHKVVRVKLVSRSRSKKKKKIKKLFGFYNLSWGCNWTGLREGEVNQRSDLLVRPDENANIYSSPETASESFKFSRQWTTGKSVYRCRSHTIQTHSKQLQEVKKLFRKTRGSGTRDDSSETSQSEARVGRAGGCVSYQQRATTPRASADGSGEEASAGRMKSVLNKDTYFPLKDTNRLKSENLSTCIQIVL